MTVLEYVKRIISNRGEIRDERRDEGAMKALSTENGTFSTAIFFTHRHKTIIIINIISVCGIGTS